MGTMTLLDCARDVEHTTVEHLAREAHEGRLTLVKMPACPGCLAAEGKPCEPMCPKAGEDDIVPLGYAAELIRRRALPEQPCPAGCDPAFGCDACCVPLDFPLEPFSERRELDG